MERHHVNDPALRVFQTWRDETLPDVLRDAHLSWPRVNADDRYSLFGDSCIIWWLSRQHPSISHCFQPGPFIRTVDMFRYAYLARYGGLYVDLDFYCLRPVATLLAQRRQHVVLGSMETPPSLRSHSIPNAWMYSPRAHPFWLLVLAMAQERVTEEFIESATGPILLFDAVAQYGSMSTAAELLSMPSVRNIAGGIQVLVTDPLPPVTILAPTVLYPLSWAIAGDRGALEKLRHGLRSDESAAIIRSLREKRETTCFTFWFRSWSRDGSLSAGDS
ncbi:glycosyltransferase [Streptomyces olivoreticuli]